MSGMIRSQPRLLAGALLLLTFGAGMVAGSAAHRWIGPPAAMAARFGRDVSGVLDALDLTPAQRVQARALLEGNAPRSEAVLREAAEQLRFVADSVDAELRKILTPAQQAKLDSLRREPVFVIKRKAAGGRTTVDTLRRAGPDSTPEGP